MKTFYNLKNVLVFLILFLALTANSPAQTPQYYNYNTTGGANTFPLGQPGGKMVQWLVAPGEFNHPSAAKSGSISSISVMMAGSGTATYSLLNIMLAQTTLTSLPTGAFYTGQMDTVYKRATVTLSARPRVSTIESRRLPPSFGAICENSPNRRMAQASPAISARTKTSAATN